MNKYYERPTGPHPSEMFLDSIHNGYGCSELTCDFCGKTHYAYLAHDDEQIDDYVSWQEHCENELKLSPDSTIVHYDCYAVTGKELCGKTFVEECPCNALWKYEEWIWQNRNTIRNYLKIRCDKEKELADEENLQNILAGID